MQLFKIEGSLDLRRGAAPLPLLHAFLQQGGLIGQLKPASLHALAAAARPAPAQRRSEPKLLSLPHHLGPHSLGVATFTTGEESHHGSHVHEKSEIRGSYARLPATENTRQSLHSFGGT